VRERFPQDQHTLGAAMLNKTIADVRRRAKRQGRIAASAAKPIAAMADGQTLHRHNAWHGPIWFLSRYGTRVDDAVARLVITNPAVVGNNDALPLGGDTSAQSQTFRFVE
jgi:hypothetical protein